MSANKTRVQVRGSIGKSVRIPAQVAGTGATIGVDFRLPDGSVPSLQQLAAALVTGDALSDQPGNIIPPGGGPAVIWQNIQFVPRNVLYPARPVIQEDDAGEDYYRMAVPGPAGVRGSQGFSGVFADDPEDPMPAPPGAAGVAGAAGSAGPPGAISAVHLWPDDPEDHISIPGAAGSPGATGAAGSPGAISTVHLYPDDAEDPGIIPGPTGAAGVAGAAGATGPPGAISAVHLWPDDPEDLIAAWTLPVNPRFQSVTIDGVAGTPLTVNTPGTVDTMALNAVSGQFTTLLFENVGALKTQLAWDNTNNRFSLGTVNAGATLRLLSGNNITACTFDGNGLCTIQNNAAGTHVINSFSGASDTLALNAPSGRFTSLLFENASVIKVQLFWDNAASLLRLGVPSLGITLDSNGLFYKQQPAPSAVNATATLTIAQLLTRIITSTTAAPVTGTLPTGTLTDAGIGGGGLAVNDSFEWSVIATGANAFTVAAGVGHTLVGSGVVATATSGLFLTQKTALNTFITYRLAV